MRVETRKGEILNSPSRVCHFLRLPPDVSLPDMTIIPFPHETTYSGFHHFSYSESLPTSSTKTTIQPTIQPGDFGLAQLFTLTISISNHLPYKTSPTKSISNAIARFLYREELQGILHQQDLVFIVPQTISEGPLSALESLKTSTDRIITKVIYDQ